MALELYYTSVPKGLKSGTSGFCTVAITSGMPAPMIQRLESLSGYRPIYRMGDPSENKNPVEYAHWRANIGGRFCSILSRVCFAGADYTGRSNKFAHHVVLESSEQTGAGPPWVMMQRGVMETAWTGEPRVLRADKKIPDGTNELRVCDTWAKATGDAGWAGVLAESFLLDASKPAYILFEPGMELLPLLNEAIALLPERVRWRVTFSTFFSQLPSGLSCSWRCCAVGTPAAQAAPANATGGVLIDLTRRMEPPHESRYVTMARTGEAAPEEGVVAVAPAVRVSAQVTEPQPAEALRDAGGAGKSIPPSLTKEADTRVVAQKETYGYGPPWRKALFWPVAVGGPILGFFLAAIIFQNVNTFSGDSPAGIDDDTLTAKLTQAEQREQEWRDQYREMKTKADGAEARVTELEGKDRDAIARIEGLEKEIENLKAQAALASASGTGEPTGPETGTDADGPKDPPETGGDTPPDTPSEGGPAQLVLASVDLPAFGKVTGVRRDLDPTRKDLHKFERLPSGVVLRSQLAGNKENTRELDRYEFTTKDGDDSFTFVFRHEDGRLIIENKAQGTMGRPNMTQLATAEISDNVLRWSWVKPQQITTQIKNAGFSLEKLVRYANVYVIGPDGDKSKRIAQVQLSKAQKLTFQLDALVAQPFDRDIDCPLELTMAGPIPAGWQLDKENSDSARKIFVPDGKVPKEGNSGGAGMPDQASLRVTIGDPKNAPASDEIRVEWFDGDNPFDKQITQAPKNGDQIVSPEHKNLQNEINRLKNSIGKKETEIENEKKRLNIEQLKKDIETARKRAGTTNMSFKGDKSEIASHMPEAQEARKEADEIMGRWHNDQHNLWKMIDEQGVGNIDLERRIADHKGRILFLAVNRDQAEKTIQQIENRWLFRHLNERLSESSNWGDLPRLTEQLRDLEREKADREKEQKEKDEKVRQLYAQQEGIRAGKPVFKLALKAAHSDAIVGEIEIGFRG